MAKTGTIGTPGTWSETTTGAAWDGLDEWHAAYVLEFDTGKQSENWLGPTSWQGPVIKSVPISASGGIDENSTRVIRQVWCMTLTKTLHEEGYQWIVPIFNGTTEGSEYEVISAVAKNAATGDPIASTWQNQKVYQYVDITNDAEGPGVDNWTWSDVANLDFKTYFENWHASKGINMGVYNCYVVVVYNEINEITFMGADGTATGTWNTGDAASPSGSAWSGNILPMPQSSVGQVYWDYLANRTVPTTTDDDGSDYLTVESWRDFQSLGNQITKVEIGLQGVTQYDTNDPTLLIWYARPVFNGTDSGSEYTFTGDIADLPMEFNDAAEMKSPRLQDAIDHRPNNTDRPAWPSFNYVDITTDSVGPSAVPSGSWTWDDVQNLDFEIYCENTDEGYAQQMLVWNMLVKVTYASSSADGGISATLDGESVEIAEQVIERYGDYVVYIDSSQNLKIKDASISDFSSDVEIATSAEHL